MKRTIYLIRHGTPEGAELMRCIGRLDVALSEKGYEEARRAGTWLREHLPGFTLYSSPLSRCLDTARFIQKETGCNEPVIVNDLTEMDAGTWDGLTFSEIREKYPAEYEERGKNLIHYQTPGGESFYDAGLRFLGGLQQILERISANTSSPVPDSNPDHLPSENLVVVGHAGVIRASLCHLGAQSFDYMLCIPQPYGGITVLEAEQKSDNTWQLTPAETIIDPSGQRTLRVDQLPDYLSK